MSGRPSFFRAYRVVPIVAMLIVTAFTFGLIRFPASLARRYAYPVHYQDAILASADRHGIDPLLVCAIIKCESGWDSSAVSAAGAQGLMQLMPTTSVELADQGAVDVWSFDPQNLSDAATNIEYGCAYLSQLQRSMSSTDEVIAAYNAGPGSVEEWLASGADITEVIRFPETALYLQRVKRVYDKYQEYYTATLSER